MWSRKSIAQFIVNHGTGWAWTAVSAAPSHVAHAAALDNLHGGGRDVRTSQSRFDIEAFDNTVIVIVEISDCRV